MNKQNSLFQKSFMIRLLFNISQSIVEIKKNDLMNVNLLKEEFGHMEQVDILYKFY